MRWRVLPIACVSIVLFSCSEPAEELDVSYLSDPAGTSALSDALRKLPVAFGDNVRVVSVELTAECCFRHKCDLSDLAHAYRRVR